MTVIFVPEIPDALSDIFFNSSYPQESAIYENGEFVEYDEEVLLKGAFDVCGWIGDLTKIFYNPEALVEDFFERV